MTGAAHAARPTFRVILALPVGGMALWNSLTGELRSLGHEVEYLSEVDQSHYRFRAGFVRSLILRFRMWVVFPLRVLWRSWSCRHSHDFLLVPNTPPFLPALVATCAPRGRLQLIQLLYDLYPDLLFLSTQCQPGSLKARFLAWCTRTALALCDATVFLGEQLKRAAESRYGAARHGVVIEVGSDSKSLLPREDAHAGVLRVIYSGNLGHAHDVDTIVDLLREPLPPGIDLAFHAYGSGYAQLKRSVGVPVPQRVIFGGPLADAEWAKVMSRSEVALITLRKGAEDVCFPSKAHSAMLAGQAIIAVCTTNSDLAETVRRANCGWVVEPGDSEGLRSTLLMLVADPEAASAAGLRAIAFANTHLDMTVIALKWAKFLAHRSEHRSPTPPA